MTPHPNHIVFNDNMFENTMAYTNSFSKLDSLTINRSHIHWTALSLDSLTFEAFQSFDIEFPTISNLHETMCAYFGCFQTSHPEKEKFNPVSDVMVTLC